MATDTPEVSIRNSRWFVHRLFLFAWFNVVMAWIGFFTDPEMMTAEWLVRIVVYSLVILAFGEVADKAIDKFSVPKQFTPPPTDV